MFYSYDGMTANDFKFSNSIQGIKSLYENFLLTIIKRNQNHPNIKNATYFHSSLHHSSH